MKTIRLAHPMDNGKISPRKPRLQWLPVKTFPHHKRLTYTVSVFAKRPGLNPASGPAHHAKPLPLFTTGALKRNFFDLPIRAKGLQPGRAYWWQVRARNQEGQVVAISEKRRFKIRDLQDAITDIEAETIRPKINRYFVPVDADASVGAAWWAERHKFMPCPPVVWGNPVKLRWRGDTDFEPAEPEIPDGGMTDPIGMIWGNEAASVYLPVYLVQHGSIYWDLSHIEGCAQVLLQISGEDGFAEPNDGNVMEDPNVINYYWGPPRITCGFEELETHLGPPPRGYPVSSSNLDLFNSMRGGMTILPSESHPDVIRQIRTIPCDESRERVDLASDPVTIHCVRYPALDVSAMTVEHIWGGNPRRVIDFAVMFEEPFPDLRVIPMVAAPSTLLISTPPGPSLMSSSSCANLSLTMNGEPVERRNSIILLSGGNTCDTYVIPLSQWPSEPGYDFRLEQEWRGGMMYDSLWDFLDPNISAAIIPGVHPSYMYCGGVYQDYDSLYGREDLPDDPTQSPFYYYTTHTGHCLPSGMVDGWYGVIPTGIVQFNNFMESTFRGTRTVTHDLSGGRPTETWLDEPMGEEEVEVHFETDNTGELRYVVPTITEPVMMREIRDSGEVLWRVRYLDGVAAGLFTTGRDPDVLYGGRLGSAAGVSRFDPPRLQIWLSVRLGLNESHGWFWADIHYDLRAV